MKTKLFYFILGAIIFSSITAIAITGINAREVSYTDSSNNETNVKSALDNVYANLNTKMALNSFGTPIYNTNQGDMQTRTSSITLNRGKYLIIKATALGSYTSTTSSQQTITNMTNTPGAISCTNNCVIRNIFSYNNKVTSSGKYDSAIYTFTNNIQHLFYVEIVEDQTTVSGSYTVNTTSTQATVYVNMIAVPINE